MTKKRSTKRLSPWAKLKQQLADCEDALSRCEQALEEHGGTPDGDYHRKYHPHNYGPVVDPIGPDGYSRIEKFFRDCVFKMRG